MLVLRLYIRTLQGTCESIKVTVLVNFFIETEINVCIYILHIFSTWNANCTDFF